MKKISTLASIDSNAGGFYPAVMFGSNLLQSAYDVIKDIVFEGGNVQIQETTENINTVDSIVISSLKTVDPIGNVSFNTYDSDTITGQNASLLSNTGAFPVTRSGIESISQTKKDVYPFFGSGSGTVNVAEVSTVSEGTKNVPTQEDTESLAPELKEVVATLTPTTATDYLTSNNIVTLSGFARISSAVAKPSLQEIGTKDVDAVTTVNTAPKQVVTGVTATGGGAAPYSDKIEYKVGADTVTVSGNGYRKLLAETANKPINVNMIRVQIIGANANELSQILSGDAYIITANGTEVDVNPFSLLDYVSPRSYRKDIIDLPFDFDIDGNTALVISGLKNSDIQIKSFFNYEF